MHEFFARLAARELLRLPCVERVYVYGSVANGTHRPDSDIDLAVIVDDVCRSFPLTIDGQPQEHQERIESMRAAWSREYGVDLHVVTYWSSDLAKGIRLPKREGHSRDLLANARELHRGLLTDLD